MKARVITSLVFFLLASVGSYANACLESIVNLSQAEIDSLDKVRALYLDFEKSSNPFPATILHKGESYKTSEYLGGGREGDVAHARDSTTSFAFKKWKQDVDAQAAHDLLEQLHATGIPTIFLANAFDPKRRQSRFRFIHGVQHYRIIQSPDVAQDTKEKISRVFQPWHLEAQRIAGRKLFDKNIILDFQSGRFFLIDVD